MKVYLIVNKERFQDGLLDPNLLRMFSTKEKAQKHIEDNPLDYVGEDNIYIHEYELDCED